MKGDELTIQRILVTAVLAVPLLLLHTACEDPVGPSEGPNPCGDVVVWFNGLGYTIDLFFTESDSLVTHAYTTGEVPNDLLCLGDGLFGVVNSASESFQVFDLETSGSTVGEVSLTPGGTPWAAALDPSSGLVYISESDNATVCVLDPASLQVTDTIPVAPNPYGLAVAAGYLFVSHGNYPDPGFTGDVTVHDLEDGSAVDTIDTPENTVWLRYYESSGLIHAGSTTYTDDGAISIIDPASFQVEATVPTGGTPGPSDMTGDGRYACGDGWNSGRVFIYDELGTVLSVWDLDHFITGVAAEGDTLYMTEFASDRVYIGNSTTLDIIDSIPTGDGPQGILLVEAD